MYNITNISKIIKMGINMKKHESIMRRVRYVEEKYGIKYARPDGKLYKFLNIIYILAWIYTLGINLLSVAGMLLLYFDANANDFLNMVVTASVCTAVLIIGFIFMCTRLKLAGIVASIVPIPVLAVSFGVISRDEFGAGFLGFKGIYYWRHLIPLALMLIMLVCMLVIYLRSEYKTNKLYNKIVENLYATYNTVDEDGTSRLTEEQWEKFLMDYDPRDYNRQFVPQTEESEESAQ